MSDDNSPLRDPDWLGCRARNAARRPLLIGFVAACVVGLAIVSVVLAPKHRRPLGPTLLTNSPADTAALSRALAQAQSRASSADAALAIARQQMLTAAAKPATDSLSPKLLARHDSLTAVLTELQALIGKVETVPLPTSYRALAASPALFANARVRALLDTLGEVERDREGFGSAGGADPMFVALTSRATEIGRAIEALASARRDSLRADITKMTAPTSTVVEARAVTADTMPWVAERDSARSAVRASGLELAGARHQIDVDRRETERARQISAITASPIAMVVAAAMFGIAFGFAGALRSEFRRPTVATAAELERATGTRVIATVRRDVRSREIDRRTANNLAPGYLEPNAESYQLAYLYVDQSAASPDVVAIVGDDPDVSAIVAMNLAAIAAENARSVLVIDTVGRSAAIQALLPTAKITDLADLVRGQSWESTGTAVSVGRDRTIDVVAGGNRPTAEFIALLGEERRALGRHYDTVFLIGPLQIALALTAGHAVDGTVVTATSGRTRLDALQEVGAALHTDSHQVFGAVLWDAPAPRLAANTSRLSKPQPGSHPPATTVPSPAV